MGNNNQSNQLIKWLVMVGDFVLLNAIIWLLLRWSWRIDNWPEKSLEIFFLVNNLALVLAQTQFSTIIHKRLIGAGCDSSHSWTIGHTVDTGLHPS